MNYQAQRIITIAIQRLGETMEAARAGGRARRQILGRRAARLAHSCECPVLGAHVVPPPVRRAGLRRAHYAGL